MTLGRQDYRQRGQIMTIPAQQSTATRQTATSVTISAAENGPYEIAGPFSMCDHDGRVVAVPEGQAVRLCRCGASGDKPFCDGSEEKIGFDGTLARLSVRPEDWSALPGFRIPVLAGSTPGSPGSPRGTGASWCRSR